MRASDFERLRVFAAVAERGSFVKAARALEVSTSSVSQSVRALEDGLGVRLLNRTTRSVALTQAGAHLLSRARPAIEDLDRALEELNAFREAPAGTLRLSVSTLSLSLVVQPVLARFLAAHPGIRVELTLADHGDLDASMDAGIRNKAAIPQDMVAVRVSPPSRFLALASPAYLAAHGRPREPAQLSGHNCIRLRTRTGLYPWGFVQDGRRVEPEVSGSLVTDSVLLAVSAAVDGAGIAYGIESHVRRELADGALEPLLEDYAAPFPGFFLYYPSRRHMPTALRLFSDFLTSEAGRIVQLG